MPEKTVTSARWAFSAQTSGSDIQTNFSADSFSPVPEPGILGLLGIGLLSIGLTSRRRKLRPS